MYHDHRPLLEGVGAGTFHKGEIMKLTMSERFELVPLIPKEGNPLLVFRGVKLNAELMPTEEEIKAWGIESSPDGGLKWKEEMAMEEVEIELGEMLQDYFTKLLDDEYKQNKFKVNHILLYRRFVLGDINAKIPGE